MLPLLEERNIVFVTAAGNGGVDQNSHAYALHETTPQFLSNEDGFRSMIVVGGVHPDGTYDIATSPKVDDPKDKTAKKMAQYQYTLNL